ncbi:MAG: AraC family transcriptional regulator [Rhizobium sp.]|nr:MAG: AraC family transcriptional regulator [Rhizobium sp.]
MQSDLAYCQSHIRQYQTDSVSQLVTAGPKNSRLLVSRLRRDTPGHGLAAPHEADAVYSVLLQLREQTNRELFLDEKCVHRGSYAARTTSIVNHLEKPCANLQSAFDNLIFIVPQSALNEIADDLGVAPISQLHCQRGGVLDETVWHLGNALLPALARPHEVGSIYAEQIMLAANTYFAQAFGGMSLRQTQVGTLAPWQLRRAKEAMISQAEINVSLKEVASACGLSVSYFVRAFKTTTGDPPHRWMMRHRVERSKSLLGATDVSLSEIAITCGFADQSHFSRVFRAFVGISPAAWRRATKT